MNASLASPGLVPDFRARFTAEGFLGMVAVGAFDGMKVELLEGELQRTMPPMTEHGRLQLEVASMPKAVLGAEPFSVSGGIGIRLGERMVVAADAAIARPRDGADRMPDADEIVLAGEVANATLVRDPGAERAAHAAAGVPHHWVVDVQGRVIHRFAEPMGGEYRRSPTVRFGEPLPAPETDRTISLG